MFNIVFAVVALALAILTSPARAQSATQGQTTSASGVSAAVISEGAVQINSTGTAELPYKVQEYTGTQTLKTTGNAIAPGVYNSSGTYACLGGASVAAGGPGWSFSGGNAREAAGCLGLHRMDKAAGRANAAARLAADKGLPSEERAGYQRQVDAFSRLWDAEYCAMEGGAAAFAAAGMECPKAAATAPAKVQPQPWQAGG